MSRIGMPGAHLGAGRPGRCLGQLVTAYADRTMDAASLHHWDLHLVACATCRAAVEAERRVLASLRSAATEVPSDLRGMLLALAHEAADASPEPEHGIHRVRSFAPHVRVHAVPPVPVAPVPVVDRGAPALHRSARRATVLAGLAAGATAAAAWGLAFAGTAGSTAAPSPSPSPGPVHAGWPSAPRFATAAFTVPGLGTSRATEPVPAPRPGGGAASPGSAESTP